MLQLRKILLPVDFSEPCLKATEYAVELATRFEATLHLLHIIEDPVVYLPMFESYSLPTPEQFETYAQDRLENWIAAEDHDGCRLELHWIHGSPARSIVEFSKKQEMDLVVMGTHGRGFATHLILGSVAEKVVRSAPCPVLTVHPQGHQFVNPAQGH